MDLPRSAVERGGAVNAWRTPTALFQALDAEFHFELDAACTRENCLAPQGIYHDEGGDALDWDAPWPGMGAAWLCPPWDGNLLHAASPTRWSWVATAEVHGRVRPVVALLPMMEAVDEIWAFYNQSDPKPKELRFVVGPLLFRPPASSVQGEPKDLGPMVVVVWRPGDDEGCRPSYIDPAGRRIYPLT